jgi:hypothetical protein
MLLGFTCIAKLCVFDLLSGLLLHMLDLAAHSTALQQHLLLLIQQLLPYCCLPPAFWYCCTPEGAGAGGAVACSAAVCQP